MPTTHEMNIGQAYLALFGRVPELDGLNYWVNLIPEGSPLSLIVDTISSAVANANISTPSDSNSDFIVGLYTNALGKSVEEDRGGVNYWINQFGNFASRGALVEYIFQQASTSPAFAQRISVLQYAIDQQKSLNKSMDLQSCVSCIRAVIGPSNAGRAIVDSALGTVAFNGGLQNKPSSSSSLWSLASQSPNYANVRRFKEMWMNSSNTAYALQVYLPPCFSTASAFPLVIALHGGGWRNGAPENIDRYCDALAARGFVVVAPNYRRSALNFNMDQMWVDLNSFKNVMTGALAASLFKTDTTRVFWWGESAGAHLAIAYARNNFERVFALYSPCNLMSPTAFLEPYVAAATPGTSTRSAYTLVYGPPFANSEIELHQGDLDTIVGPHECDAMAGPNCTIVRWPTMGHGFYNSLNNGANPPDAIMLDKMTDAAVSFYLT